MSRTFHPQNTPSFHELWQPVEDIFIGMPLLEARGNKPLQMNFEHQLKALIFYHLIARSKRGFMAQIRGGLITYLLLAIYCQEHYQEKVSIKRVRELRIKIQNESRNLENVPTSPASRQTDPYNFKDQKLHSYAIT